MWAARNLPSRVCFFLSGVGIYFLLSWDFEFPCILTRGYLLRVYQFRPGFSWYVFGMILQTMQFPVIDEIMHVRIFSWGEREGSGC